ncbi:hypothetical protein ACHAXA_003248 [Cyclostephanos tholiformis]|uniref:Helicase-associated domain-containing protein n=1 Tax=Cyclostephanos tholiformis TaxID=382380 RepID=A0ABD3SB12_9STRA
MNEGKGSSMDRLRIQQLNELGFKWTLKHKDQPVLVDSDDETSEVDQKPAAKISKPKALTWEIGMQQLRAFQLTNGNLDIPHIYAADQPLGNFVKSIRQSYKHMQKGHDHLNKLLNDQRIFELNSMGFILQVRQREPWEKRFEELKKHVKRHGNCEVPKDTPLGVWILNQRSQFKLMLARKKTSLSQQRINSLNSIGFDWRVNTKDGDSGHFNADDPNNIQEYWTDDSDSEDFQSTVSDSELPALEEPNLIVAYSYYENNSDVGNFNDFSSFNTQYTEQFSFKTSPNARRVSDDSRLNVEDIDDADVKPSAVVSSCYVDNLGANHQSNPFVTEDDEDKRNDYEYEQHEEVVEI